MLATEISMAHCPTFVKVSQASPVCRSGKSSVKMQMVEGLVGVLLPGDNRSNRRKSRPSANLSTESFSLTGLKSSPVLRGDSPTTNRLGCGMEF
jgi:hypothetical protein